MVSQFNNTNQVIHANPSPNISGITRKDYNNEGGNEDMELPIFDMMAIAMPPVTFQATTRWEKVVLDLYIG